MVRKAYVKYHYDGPTRQWGWTLRSGNHAIVAFAYGYNTKKGAREAFYRVEGIFLRRIDEKK